MSDCENFNATDHATIPVRWVRSRRARRHILRVDQDGTVRVTIPPGATSKEAKEFLAKHWQWVLQQRNRRAAQCQARCWQSGSSILWKGEWHTLQAVFSDGTLHVSLADQSFRLQWRKPEPPPQNLRPIVQECMRAVAKRELVERTVQLSRQHDIPISDVVVRNQRTRWGSCSCSGVISLNWRLIQTPPWVADYIILHELAHRIYMNHSPSYWKAVAALCPDYDVAERWIKLHGSQLLDP